MFFLVTEQVLLWLCLPMTNVTGNLPNNLTFQSSKYLKVETLKKLKELVDIGILSQEEFDMKRHEILGL